ncbi:MAG: sensor histidine kinase [Lacrimispora sp.]
MKRIHMNLYQKFTLVIICVGLIPMGIISTVIMNRMFKEYGNSLKFNYEQAVAYINSGIDSMLDSYNDISKMPYYYNYSSEGNFQVNYMSFDNLRKILYGEEDEAGLAEAKRQVEMGAFLQNVQSVDSSIESCHFVVDERIAKAPFHASRRNSFLRSEALFDERLKLDELDRTSKQMMLISTHPMDYYNRATRQVFTVGRNYFDLTKAVGDTVYIGTLFIDVDLERLINVFKDARFNDSDRIYVVDRAGNCFYSSSQDMTGVKLDLTKAAFNDTKTRQVIDMGYGRYGLKTIVVMDAAAAYQRLNQMRNMLYVFLGGAVAALLFGSVWFSRRLTRPIRNMMNQMSQIENGNFKVELTVESKDEIGTLSRRFNQMSQELETYINKSYVAQVKQSEAEMTALKSQIYPHFLYNTLEIIRMTAVENEDEKVSNMIEALSQQIHYIIGPVQDLVSLDTEVDIIKKYIYLLNCRISGKVNLSVEFKGLSHMMVPKLILQPIVENSYVHGLKPKNGTGRILIDAEIEDDRLIISLMDNGVGMSEETLERLNNLLESDEIGIKNEHNWQSIGLKNVHDRIRYLYGKKYGLEITSTVSVGTMVRIIMPAGKEEGFHDSDDISG